MLKAHLYERKHQKKAPTECLVWFLENNTKIPKLTELVFRPNPVHDLFKELNQGFMFLSGLT